MIFESFELEGVSHWTAHIACVSLRFSSNQHFVLFKHLGYSQNSFFQLY